MSRPSASPAEDVLLALAGWPAVFDRILAGITHDLNGRVTALRGFLELAALGEEPAEPGPFLNGEVDRLEALAHALWTLAEEGFEPELMAPGPFLAELVPLHEKHRGIESVRSVVDADPDAPPFRAARRRFRRALLLALAQVAWGAHGAGLRRMTVACRCGAEGGLLIELTPGEGNGSLDSDPEEGAAERAPAGEEALSSLAELLALDEVRLRSVRGAEGLSLALQFPPA